MLAAAARAVRPGRSSRVLKGGRLAASTAFRYHDRRSTTFGDKMKRHGIALAAVLFAAGNAHASAGQRRCAGADAKDGCAACHAIDKRSSAPPIRTSPPNTRATRMRWPS
jgi:hypothetical protein